jgi:hypothetical protein
MPTTSADALKPRRVGKTLYHPWQGFHFKVDAQAAAARERRVSGRKAIVLKPTKALYDHLNYDTREEIRWVLYVAEKKKRRR